MKIPSEKPADTAESVGQRWPLRVEDEHREQWEWFKARWNAHSEAVSGPLEVRWAQLDREPPFAVIGREGAEESITVALSRDGAALRFIRTEGGRNMTLPSAARVLEVRPVEMDRARAAILDGLEQSERIAGRTPVQAALNDWVDLSKLARYRDAIESGYMTATSTLLNEGINPDGVWTDEHLSLSDEAVQRFAVLGRSATANAAAVLEHGDRAEDLMVAVEVLTGNPWEWSVERKELEDQLDERLRGIGLHTIAEQSRRDFNRARVRGVAIAGGQISNLVAERPRVERLSSRNVQQRNEERMERQVTARIRDEDPTAALRSNRPRLSR
ncbi:hypothetical protein [Brachybacterium sp.]|uniref:hypothetical protein n=1 Tax=Brachybacterium sp. TaxID=1891286 RepID=UPI002ED1C46A